jgi:hypothetical protein
MIPSQRHFLFLCFCSPHQTTNLAILLINVCWLYSYMECVWVSKPWPNSFVYLFVLFLCFCSPHQTTNLAILLTNVCWLYSYMECVWVSKPWPNSFVYLFVIAHFCLHALLFSSHCCWNDTVCRSWTHIANHGRTGGYGDKLCIGFWGSMGVMHLIASTMCEIQYWNNKQIVICSVTLIRSFV